MEAHSATSYSGTGRMTFQVLNYLDREYGPSLASDVSAGMNASQKYLPCKYFYDAYGSKLFESICDLPEYYLTRTEIEILRRAAPGLMENFACKDLVELGSGSSLKVDLLLGAVGGSDRASLRYVPVDISESAVLEASWDLLCRYPEIEILGVVADFMSQLHVLPNDRPYMLCFLGSTIGNLDEAESISFFRSVSSRMRSDDRFLVGFDMVKSRETMEAAYNDSRGITAKFNRNILSVLNRELGAHFDQSDFEHLAFFNHESSRIEMHLRARRDMSVNIAGIGSELRLKKGETIHTENSRKFTRNAIVDLADRSDLRVCQWYTDPEKWFSLVSMAPA